MIFCTVFKLTTIRKEILEEVLLLLSIAKYYIKPLKLINYVQFCDRKQFFS